MKFKLALLAVCAAATGQAMACYTVYDGNNRVVYNAQVPPVDMSQPLHQTLPRTYPGGHMVFDNGLDCPARNTERAAIAPRGVVTASASPLLTDRSTAQAMHLPYTMATNTIAIVPASAAARVDLPTFNVIPADTAVAAARTPATAVMGAGPSTAVMGAGPAPQRGARGPVITELHDPPMTAVQQGNSLSLSR